MAAIRHLNQAPVIEAILGFQVDASKAWDAEVVREGLARYFPDFPQIQEQRHFESQISLVPGKDPESSTKVHPIGAFILRREDGSAAVQVRRDGFAFSQLRPYPDWDVFIEAAMEQWKVFSEWLGIGAPFNVFIRFINRVSYPCEGFKLGKYFDPLPNRRPAHLGLFASSANITSIRPKMADSPLIPFSRRLVKLVLKSPLIFCSI